MNASRLSPLFLVGLSLGLAACSGENLTLPSEGEPAAIAVDSGDNQSGRVGEQLAQALTVQVTDTKNRPVEGATVEFDFTTAGGSATPASSVTDADGRARSQITLGTQMGTVTGVARVPVPAGTVPVQTTFTTTALSADADSLTAESGDNQSGQVGTTLGQRLVVKVSDKFGNPIPGVTIGWTAPPGTGSVSPESSPTDGNGLASAERTLGTSAGEQTTEATAAGLLGSPVTFTHTAQAGNASRIVKVSGDGQSGLTGTELAEPLVVQVFDAENNPIADRPVAWVPGVGDGTVSPTTSNTDAQGLTSTRWTVGAAGNNTVNAVVSGVGTATFNATATAGSPSATRSKVAAAPDNFAVGGSSSITVTVRDASGNRIAGAMVTPTSSGTGNSFSPASAATDDNGVATFAFSSTVAEKKTITVVAAEVTLHDTPVITVFLHSSTTQIGISPEPSISGQPVHVTWTVTGIGGGTPTGTMTIFSSQEATGDQCSNVPVSLGACDLVLNVVGPHQIGASYSGDGQFEGSGDQANHVVAPVNQAPVAVNDVYSTPGGGLDLVVTAPGVLANDTDTDGPLPLTAQLLVGPTQGVLLFNSDGSFTYTPSVAAPATDIFTYQANDGDKATSATVTITIQ